MNNIENQKACAICNVPDSQHGTACGWGNATIDGQSFGASVPEFKVTFSIEEDILKKELKKIREAFQWTFDNMGTPHTSDHFNIPMTGLGELDRLLSHINRNDK